MKKSTIVLLVVLLGIAAFYWVRYRTTPSIELYNLTVQQNETQTMVLKDMASPTTVVHFMASWCGPCMHELPFLDKFATEHPNIKTILITDDSWDRINTMKLRLGPNTELVRVNSLEDTKVFSIPLTYIVQHGNVVYKHLGVTDWQSQEIAALIH